VELYVEPQNSETVYEPEGVLGAARTRFRVQGLGFGVWVTAEQFTSLRASWALLE